MSQSYAGSWWRHHPTGDQSQAERHRFGGTLTIGSGPLPRPHELRFADGMVSLLHEPVDGKLGMGRLLQPTYVPMVHGLVGDGEEITLLDVVER